MKIGAILPHCMVFGGVRRYLELGNAFVARGHAFTVYTPQGEPPAWLPFAGSVRPLDAIDAEEHDALICGSYELLAAFDRARARLKVFYLQIEDAPGEAEVVRSGRYRIMVNSSGLRARVRRRYGIEPLDGIGGVNPDMFHPPRERRRGGRFHVLCYGRLSRPRKGTRFVVGAVRWMHRRGFDVELDLFDTVGPGEPDPRAGFDPGVPFRFYLNLPQERMAPLYHASDVFVSAERRAGWNNTAAEAAACALPIVCTRSGTEDFAVDRGSALVVPLRHPWFIRRSLVELYRNPELGARLGAEANRRIMECTWEKLCDRMERTFRRLLDADAGGTAAGVRS